MISKIPLRLPLARKSIPFQRNVSPADFSEQNSIRWNNLNNKIEEQQTHLDDTDQFSNSLLVQEILNATHSNDRNDTAETDSVPISNVGTPRITNALRNEFHLSNLSKGTTSETVLNYLKAKGIDDISKVKLTSLLPKNRDPSTISQGTH